MLKSSIHHGKSKIDIIKIWFPYELVSTNIPSARSTTKNTLSNNNLSIATAPQRARKDEFINYTALDTFK